MKKNGLIEIPYAGIGIVLGVNSSVPNKNITYEELVNIYLGKKTNWDNGEMIVVLIREKQDSSNMILEKEIPGFSKALDESIQKKGGLFIIMMQK